MARLAAVCRSADYLFERRQIPLVVDDNLTVGGPPANGRPCATFIFLYVISAYTVPII